MKRSYSPQLLLPSAFVCVVFVVGLALLSDRNAQISNAQEVSTAESSRLAAVRAKLIEIVGAQSDAWNRGDIDGFMTAYWKSESLTFSSGGKTSRGWNATCEGYKTRYPDLATMGTLTFSELEVQLLSQDAALMLGRWELKREQAPIGGNFSLVWQRRDGKWLIVHDHTSTLANAVEE